MFGFLPGPCQCFTGDLRSVYRQHFCGLGTALHLDYGTWGRWLVNRDSTFLSLLASALADEPPCASSRRCCNPFGSPRLMVNNSEGARFAAAVTICGLTTKLEDNTTDETGLRRWVARQGAAWTREVAEKARSLLRCYEFPTHQVQAALLRQPQLEKSGVPLEEVAEPTARAFGTICGHLPEVVGNGGNATHLLTQAGWHLGRLIYTMDAAEDWENDRRRGRFNPLPIDGPTRQEVVATSMARDFKGLQAIDSQLKLPRFGTLISPLWTTRAEARTAERLRMAFGLRREWTERRTRESKERWGSKCDCCGDCCCRGGCDCCFDCGPKDSGVCDYCPCDCS